MQIDYRANNSGGHWWVKDDQWRALEAAGWDVVWGGLYFCNSKFSFDKKPPGKSYPCNEPHSPSSEEEVKQGCPGHRKYDTADEVKGDRYLGAIATSAYFECDSMKEALQSFEKVTGMSVSEEGCNCCGPPHSFSGDGVYCSGEECLGYLFDNAGQLTLREAYEAADKQ